MQLAQEQWAGQRGWSPLSWADSAAHVVRSGVQRGAVPSRPWSAGVCVCVGGGDESPERNADPRARPGRPAPVRGRALRKGSGHPEECGGFPRIVVHVGTRCLREAGPEAARAAQGAPRPRRLEEGVSDAPPHPGSGTPRPVQHADPLLLSPAGASGHRLPGCLQVRTCPGLLSEHQRPRPRVQGPHTGVSTSPEPALLQVLSEALSTALGEHLVTPGADQQASDVAPRPGTASASLGLLRLCWRQWGAPAGRLGARSGARGRPWAVAVPSPGWASPPRALFGRSVADMPARGARGRGASDSSCSRCWAKPCTSHSSCPAAG